jgi:hypothetical protein
VFTARRGSAVDHVELLFAGQADEVDGVAGDPDGQFGVLLGVLHGVLERRPAEDVDVHVEAAGGHVRVVRRELALDLVVDGQPGRVPDHLHPRALHGGQAVDGDRQPSDAAGHEPVHGMVVQGHLDAWSYAADNGS